MAQIDIVKVEQADISALASIGRQTFIETFESGNNPSDFSAYLDEAFDEAQLLREVQTEGSDFYFAKVDGQTAGYLKLNTGDAQTEKVDGDTLEIERIYVDGSMQGSGVGKALFEFATDIARRKQMDAIWLGVWEENPKAIAFYEHQGFRPFGVHTFMIGTDAQRDILMRLELAQD
ncbi:GNAT family N-acetyltransferase [Sphingomicrobium marinum]|uniref:GNAT family N-acetyltransferase n=1 Tax=Sphingomicrobium marinum TaxID=1227950 RepID=UPI0022407E4D|nr:GNAT family N-acetyltransferase [Sphingomicrobium marinum]